ncbi:hypothetical protein JXJ21_09980 [candidate division KSB1 bacterium]|nr:hypothetical protein [candidate division KSB1 bacterium]
MNEMFIEVLELALAAFLVFVLAAAVQFFFRFILFMGMRRVFTRTDKPVNQWTVDSGRGESLYIHWLNRERRLPAFSRILTRRLSPSPEPRLFSMFRNTAVLDQLFKREIIRIFDEGNIRFDLFMLLAAASTAATLIFGVGVHLPLRLLLVVFSGCLVFSTLRRWMLRRILDWIEGEGETEDALPVR